MGRDEVMALLKKEKEIVDELIKKYLPEKIDNNYIEWLVGKASYKHTSEILQKVLSEPIWEFLNRGGKRWRPALFFLFTEALGGDKEKVKDFAIILELLHNGSIIVDDIEDNSDIRRGKPALHKIHGVDVAINAGNFLYFLPLIAAVKKSDDFSEKTLLRLLKACIEEMIKIHLGQGADIGWHKGLVDVREIDEKQYLQMCAYKTGVLSRLAARLAVILTGGSTEMEEKLGKLGESIGVLFQIQDDILNIKPSKHWGKDFGDDITEGKITLMVIHTLKNAKKEDAERLIEILRMHTKEQKLIQEAVEIMNKYRSMDYAKQFARNMLNDVWQSVEPMLPDSEAKTKLKQFIEFVIERDI